MLLNCGVGEDSWDLQGDQPWDFFGRNDAKVEAPVLWPPHAKSWLIWKNSDAGRYWEQEKGTTEDEMAGWHHGLDGCESGWTAGVGDGQGGLACCDSWGRKELDTTEQLNWTHWTELISLLASFQLPHYLMDEFRNKRFLNGMWLSASYSFSWKWDSCRK